LVSNWRGSNDSGSGELIARSPVLSPDKALTRPKRLLDVRAPPNELWCKYFAFDGRYQLSLPIDSRFCMADEHGTVIPL